MLTLHKGIQGIQYIVLYFWRVQLYFQFFLNQVILDDFSLLHTHTVHIYGLSFLSDTC